jgi:DNA replicative helicase MCM subunit Mcm2 (Cdc46/Mcm family)
MYAVIVCPKCRIFAQIIDYNTKTFKCKNCNATLKTKTLRIYYKSDELNQMVAARTQIQADLHNQKEDYIFAFNEINEKKTNAFVHKTIVKKDEKKLILAFLDSVQSEIKISEFKEHMVNKGMDGEKFDKAISNLLQFGEIYFPKKGLVKIVK